MALVKDLWNFIENGGETEEFFRLRERVREQGLAVYDFGPAFKEALETIAASVPGDTCDFDTIQRVADDCLNQFEKINGGF